MFTYHYYIVWFCTMAANIVLPVACLLSWLAVAQATKRRLRTYLKWLVPFAVGNTLAAVGTLLSTAVTLLRIPSPAYYEILSLISIFSIINTVVILYGIVGLWKMLKGLPLFQKTAVADAPGHRVWPPPPQV
jgi:hypothetical protein